MSTRLVEFYVMRHGEKDGDALTETGREQVRQATREYLADAGFFAALSSEMARAHETTRVALKELDQAMLTTRQDPGFGYEHATRDYPEDTIQAAMLNVQSAVKAGAKETVRLWLRLRPASCQIRGRFTECLFKWAARYADRMEGEPLMFLVGSHSPCSELAVLDPDNTPRLDLAGIVKYVVRVDTETLEAQLVGSEVIFQGFPEV
ncbi:MAG: phosphoglycerate mutase family protein [Patescibacteria group bacterium]|nr:phosphoglycerate mutase family protein [Patescibacteria group bacterium]